MAEADGATLEWVAEVMAHLKHYAKVPREEVLERLSVDAARFDAAATQWSKARHSALATGSSEVARSFGAALGRARRRLVASKVAFADLKPMRARDDDDAALDRTATLNDAAQARALPFEAARGLQPALPAPSPKPRAERRHDDLDATAAIPHGVLAAATPFERSPAAPIAPAVPTAPTPPNAPAAPTAPTADLLDRTEIGGMVLPALPFGAARGPVAASFASPLGTGSGSRGDTVGLSSEAAPRAAPPAGVADLTLPQYASLRAELHGAADEAPILARYGVPPDGRRALEAHWRARFAADPVLRMTYVKAHASYAAWLRSRGSGG